ncbi:non-specific serine/threonine protein kinase [Ranunculus cassubicifolius]
MALSSPPSLYFIYKKSLSSSRSGAGAATRRHCVCCCCWCLVLLCFLTSFSAASPVPAPSVVPHIKPLPLFQPIISTPSLSPSSQPSSTTTHHHHHPKRLILIISLSISAFVLTLIMGFMAAFLKKFKIKTNNKRSKRVEDAEMPQTTQFSDVKVQNNTPVQPNQHPIRKFSWEEIVELSSNFSTVVGQGGFSTVYLANFPDNSSTGALKIYPKSDRLNKIFKQELDILLHLRHDNIVQLLGYCSDESSDEMDAGLALVFEYVPNGSLQERLHENGNPLPSWKSRMWIAYQLATAIQYLHDKCTFPIVHGDIKASNILLDDQLNCKLCDFGSAKMGFFAPPSAHSLMGSPGYTDPHYIRTGMASTKNDVYSFGVILLELITGLEAFCPEKRQLLTAVAGPLLRGDVVDPRPLMVWAKQEEVLDNPDSHQEVVAMASIAATCLRQQPSLRPSMADILTTMTNEIPSISTLLA